ncbi:hypothetical protein Acr_00g0085930 [Actinidia rufa]|uniref:Uncharacterized protein n=1 Tax=Actinidia rufa TaxID=165716 RepID=A0A7J0DVW8_9ERIC|nr:hypothetical protein Acr_00g0085930 [Actinidia rufa]
MAPKSSRKRKQILALVVSTLTMLVSQKRKAPEDLGKEKGKKKKGESSMATTMERDPLYFAKDEAYESDQEKEKSDDDDSSETESEASPAPIHRTSQRINRLSKFSNTEDTTLELSLSPSPSPKSTPVHMSSPKSTPPHTTPPPLPLSYL